MTGGLLAPALFGLAGTLVLVALGVWQLDRLEEKRARSFELESRLAAAPGPLPARPDPERDRFRPVVIKGRIGGPSLKVIVSTAAGPGLRVISPVEADGRRILIDRGIVAADQPVPRAPSGSVRIVGDLHWPDETDAFTPDPEDGLWYARDVTAMAVALNTEEVLIVAREVPGDTVTPLPVEATAIPNNHLAYAVQWFALAAVWAGMTLYLLWRIRLRQV